MKRHNVPATALLPVFLVLTTSLAARSGQEIVQDPQRTNQNRASPALDQCKIVLDETRVQFDRFIQTVHRLESRIASSPNEIKSHIRSFLTPERSRATELKRRIGDADRRAASLTGNLVRGTGEFCTYVRTLSQETRARLRAIQSFEVTVKFKIAEYHRFKQSTGQFLNETEDRLKAAIRKSKGVQSRAATLPQLRHAFDVQERAKKAMNADRLLLAKTLSLRARELITDIASAAVEQRALHDQIEAHLRRTGEMIVQIESRLNTAALPRVARLVEIAKQHLNKGANSLQRAEMVIAMRHAQKAEAIIDEISLRAQNTRQRENKITQLKRKMQQARELIEDSQNEKARAVFDKARTHFEKARSVKNNTRLFKAELHIATKLTARAVDIARSDTAARSPHYADIQKTRLIINKADAVALTADKKAEIKQARELVEQAISQSRPQAAKILLNKATSLAFDVLVSAH
ncbi:MAG: hypothetical protein GF398_14900 [Chitinivibrionales bacterium]|nr:hypothetical protein [Chitinivibrionales bacterium]